MSFEPALLVALDLDETSHAHFEALRQRFFPADRNRVPAHVMLFHRLTLAKRSTFEDDLRHVAAAFAPFDVEVRGPYSIGKGVAYRLQSVELLRLHATLARKWTGELTAQDREPYRPHVVVQNKVTAETARQTLEMLGADSSNLAARATGLTLWLYRNGFWEDPVRFFLTAQSG